MMPELPMEIDPTKLYRVWFRAIKDGTETHQKVTGYVKFVRDGDGYGIRVSQPGDTEMFIGHGSWSRIQEHDPSKVINHGGT